MVNDARGDTPGDSAAGSNSATGSNSAAGSNSDETAEPVAHVVATLRERLYGAISCLATLAVLTHSTGDDTGAWSRMIAVSVAMGGLWATSLLAEADVAKAHGPFQNFAQRHRSEPDSRWLQTQFLGLTSSLVTTGRQSDALLFASKIADPATKAVVLELVGRAVTTPGSLGTASKFLKANPLSPPDQVATLRGVVQAIVSDDAK